MPESEAPIHRRTYGVIFPILLPLDSVNQRLPSGPTAMPCGFALAGGIGYSVKLRIGVIFPI